MRKDEGLRNKEQGKKNKDPSSHLPFILERTITNTVADSAVTVLHNLPDNASDHLADPLRLAPGFPAVPVKFVIRSKAVRWERALAGFSGQTAGGENQAQPVLMTNVCGLEPGTFGKPLIFWTLLDQAKSV